MNRSSIGLKPSRFVNATQVNEKASLAVTDFEGQRNAIPDEVFIFRYKIDGHERQLNLRKLFEVDVTELSELTIANLRAQIEQIASIRLTLERAYEQSMEDYGIYMINYKIWWADSQEKARQSYWQNQKALQAKHSLAASGLKPPTQDDLESEVLRSIGMATEFKTKQQMIIKFQRMKSLYENVDGILKGREFDLKTIIDTRLSK